MKHPKIEVASNITGRLGYNGLWNRRGWPVGMGVLVCTNQGSIGMAMNNLRQAWRDWKANPEYVTRLDMIKISFWYCWYSLKEKLIGPDVEEDGCS